MGNNNSDFGDGFKCNRRLDARTFVYKVFENVPLGAEQNLISLQRSLDRLYVRLGLDKTSHYEQLAAEFEIDTSGQIEDIDMALSIIMEVYSVAILVGVWIGSDDPNALSAARAKQAQIMRAAREQKPRAVELRDAIEAERRPGPAKNPYKEAEAILAAVNARLRKAGFVSATVDQIYRRLKSPRS